MSRKRSGFAITSVRGGGAGSDPEAEHAEPGAPGPSRFRLVRLPAAGETLRRGRWICRDFYEREAAGSVRVPLSLGSAPQRPAQPGPAQLPRSWGHNGREVRGGGGGASYGTCGGAEPRCDVPPVPPPPAVGLCPAGAAPPPPAPAARTPPRGRHRRAQRASGAGGSRDRRGRVGGTSGGASGSRVFGGGASGSAVFGGGPCILGTDFRLPCLQGGTSSSQGSRGGTSGSQVFVVGPRVWRRGCLRYVEPELPAPGVWGAGLPGPPTSLGAPPRVWGRGFLFADVSPSPGPQAEGNEGGRWAEVATPPQPLLCYCRAYRITGAVVGEGGVHAP